MRSREEETVSSSLVSNSLEFEGIKIRIVELLPDSEEEHRNLSLEPLLDESNATVEVSHYIGQGNEIAQLLGEDGNGCPLDFDGGFLGSVHCLNRLILVSNDPSRTQSVPSCREHLIEFIEQAGQLVPKDLICLAQATTLGKRREFEVVRLDAQAGGDVVAD